jgi:hypothetical protein
MNDQKSPMEDLERSLRALAAEDCHMQAPPHVHAAVMQTWDAVRPFARHRRLRRSRRAALLAAGSLAAAVSAVVVMSRAPSGPSRTEPVVSRVSEKPPLVTNVPPADRDTPVEARRARPRRPRSRREAAPPHYGPGMVLVADPLLDASATSIVRVRLSRTALVTLGIPLVEPNDGGTVDLEILVGEDGVARTIRRALPVGVRKE